MTAIEIVRQHVGRRPRITREEMTAILFSLPTDLVAASTIVGRAQDGETYYIDRQWVAPMEARAATAHAWAAACRRINCISVMRGSYYPNSDVEVAPVDGLIVRYDSPGTMHPLHHAEILFVPATAAARRETIDYLRRHAGRVLIVREDNEAEDA